MEKNNAAVAHVARCYHELSQNWIRTQMCHPTRYQPFVVARYTENEDRWKGVVLCYAVQERPAIECFLNRVFCRAFGFYPSHYLFAKAKQVRLSHAHFGPESFCALPLARACRRPLVTTFYGYDASRLPEIEPERRERCKELFEQDALSLAEGAHLADQLRRLGCPAHKISVQYLGASSSTASEA